MQSAWVASDKVPKNLVDEYEAEQSVETTFEIQSCSGQTAVTTIFKENNKNTEKN